MYVNWFLTYVEFRDVEHFPPANHVFPLNEEFEGVCPLSGRDELWAQKPDKERQRFKKQILHNMQRLCLYMSVRLRDCDVGHTFAEMLHSVFYL